MIIINFKNYKTGNQVLNLAKKIQKYSKKIIVAVPCVNLKEVSGETNLKVYAQHVNSKTGPRDTGFTTAKSVRDSGVSGTLLNHSEHPVYFDILKKTISECKKYKLKTIVCTGSIYEAKKIMKLKPDAIAYEDPKLIATGKSITKYKPKSIIKFVKIFKNKNIMPLCGAGISTIKDCKKAWELGCMGVIISSAVVNSKNPDKILKGLYTYIIQERR